MSLHEYNIEHLRLVKDPESGVEYTEPGMNIDVVTAIVTRYMDDEVFQATVFGVLAREIFDSVHKRDQELTRR